MNYIKKYLGSIRQYSFPSARALEKVLDEVREAHAAVNTDLTRVREDLQRTRDDDAKLHADLQQQVRHIDEERSNARNQVEDLERSLADADQRQKSTQVQVDSLETKLEEERSNALNQFEDLGRSLADAEQQQKSTQAHMDSLEPKLAEERIKARNQIEHLERSLANADQRQKSTQAHMHSLETKLAEERNRHEASMHATETSLARIQESMQVESETPQRSLLKLMIIAGVLFVTGTLIGAFTVQSLQDRSQELAVVDRDIRDMRVFMKQKIDNQDALLKELTLALNRQTFDEQAFVEEIPLKYEAQTLGAGKQQQKIATFTPDIQEVQAKLIALGFDLGMSKPNGELGIKTKQALQEFKQFYLPHSVAHGGVTSEPLVALILKSADLTRADVARFNIGGDVLAAIRLGSIRTGVDFSFLMEVARVESNFNPTVRAPLSSATGLFQFKDHNWLETVRTYGADYGLKDYASQVKLIDDEEHLQQTIVRDPLQLEVLALRLNPRLSALMAAENIKRNLQFLSEKISHEPGRTDLYLSHFFGPVGAVMFLKTLDEEPTTIAGVIFPKEAARNPVVFHNRQYQPRTVAEVYRWFDSKFNTARYDERNPG